MHPYAERRHTRPLSARLPGTLALVMLAVASLAAAQPRVDNPHGKFKEDCQLCHNAKSWSLVRVSPKFDHGRYGFPLTGAHATSDCMSCHKALDFSQSRTACASCHEDPHRGEMGTECARCHGARSFVDRGPMVRAHEQTRFPLTASHAAVDCEGCHQPAAQGQMQYKSTSTECRSCHMAQYQGARNPDHVAGGFPTDCQTCHNATVWTAATFNHDLTSFPLTGAHRAARCQQCHATGDFKVAGTTCYACHTNTYAGASPVHTATSFPPAACASCHTTGSWSTTFNHSTTSFPLTGAHVAATCTSCHGDGVYAGKSTACYSCHTAEYTGASPPHTPASFPTAACATCHNTTTFANATFDHNLTMFPLTGAHVTAACTSCHGDGVYAGKSTACYSCHATDYANATPPHDTVNYPTAGCVCHTTITWAGATAFDHTAAGFPLTGLHATPPRVCADCHASGHTGTSPDCYSCHTAEYAAAVPRHDTGNFPTTTSNCITCHAAANTGHVTWTGGTFASHTWFPITSGRHSGIDCMNCHNAATNLASYSCARSCHTNSLSDHPNVNGFSLTTVETQCYVCHPRGNGG